MYTNTTTSVTSYWFILPHVNDANTTLVPLDNIAFVAPAEKHGGSFVYLKSHGYAIETAWPVDVIIEKMKECT